MRAPHELASPAGARLTLFGGILGVREDVAPVENLLRAAGYDLVLLGIPFEDLDAIRATSGSETTKEFERDETDDFYLKQLEKYGTPAVPPPDLYAAYRYAEERGLPVEAIDLGDEAHSEIWTKSVSTLELLRSNRALRRIRGHAFGESTIEGFAEEWDRTVNGSKGLRHVQDERESWMASRIDLLSRGRTRVLALVPYVRAAGVARLLTSRHGFETPGRIAARPPPGKG